MNLYMPLMKWAEDVVLVDLWWVMDFSILSARNDSFSRNDFYLFDLFQNVRIEMIPLALSDHKAVI